ncbi:hypothetical protein [Streptomyces sp. NPDC058718]|uniref:hypothetical protein n=1 Tax=Streptomyces sp. NPDC058718 TaxID=3346610 RepID=UPI0036CB1EE1
MDADAAPDVVRAQLALGCREDAVALARALVPVVSGPREAVSVAQVMVLLGRHDEAVALLHSLDPAEVPEALLGLVPDLVAAGEYGRARGVLGGLHGLGRRCAEALGALAVADPEPARARESATVALHLGLWYEVLPAVLHCEPGAVPLVLEEADRLRRALEV